MADPMDGHAEHDPMLIASLLDRDRMPDIALAETRIATCASCAALHADLVALSRATAMLPTPPRPRGFTLTAADAERLIAAVPGEPGVRTPRLGGVMTDPNTTAHATHDRILVASLADHTLAPAERAATEALVATCTECAALHSDLLALRAATRAMPTPSRPRDFVLSSQDAGRLRSGGWRRFLANLGSSRDALSRPLAVGLTTLGLAGLLVGTVPSVLTGFGGSAASAPQILSPVGAPVPEAASSGADTAGSGPDSVVASPAAAAPAAAASAAPLPDAAGPVVGAAQSSGAEPSGGRYGALDRSATPPPGSEAVTNGSSKGGNGGATGGSGEPDSLPGVLVIGDEGGLSMLVVLSGAFLIAGLGLFAIRWTARRLTDG
ncbi:MAG: hypothetical protein ABJC39_08155 [Chloroflexota bacterium]